MFEFPLSWDFSLKLHPFLINAETMLGISTRDGEFLISLQPLPKITKALKSYPPNVFVARASLEPIKVGVHEVVDETNLPYETHSFDSLEVYRLLKPDCHFVTEQVG